jgi:hypothetical protein
MNYLHAGLSQERFWNALEHSQDGLAPSTKASGLMLEATPLGKISLALKNWLVRSHCPYYSQKEVGIQLKMVVTTSTDAATTDGLRPLAA